MADKPLTVVRREDLTPICPHCDTEITEVYAKEKGVPLIEGRTAVYFCPHCSKVLGFGQGRML